ncbi:hypothetical protein HYC85_016414 [Camellia sinensis]|uniref:Uncharacterized protein n=1 Tax=Camellia sinensis TaxID=4442 RepID=A0A7J7H3B4_CAMSI|nr:hypothetical protein HYC85_016414 [Camellia sinensis]
MAREKTPQPKRLKHLIKQPLALDIWKSVIKSLDPGSEITALTNGPSTTLSQIILFENTSSVIQVSFVIVVAVIVVQNSCFGGFSVSNLSVPWVLSMSKFCH